MDIHLIRDGDGSFEELIADDIGNSGEYLWNIPVSIAAHDDYRIRVTRVDNSALTDESNNPFSITEPISTYYVNLAGDTDFSDNEYTTAAGSDANSGLFPNEPKLSIRSVLEAYDLGPGDTILVDTGQYDLSSNIVVTADDAGVTIRGAADPLQLGHETILNRNNTASGSYVFELNNADGLTLDLLTITGGYYGVYAGSSSDSDNVTIRDSRIHSNAREEILLETSNDGATITGTVGNSKSQIYDTGSYIKTYEGIELKGNSSTVSHTHVYDERGGIRVTGQGNLIEYNTVHDCSASGIYHEAPSYDTGTTIANNVVYASFDGIYAEANSGSVKMEIRGNQLYQNSQRGIYVRGPATVSENTAWDNDYGIRADFGAVAENNEVFGNNIGINVGSYQHGAQAPGMMFTTTAKPVSGPGTRQAYRRTPSTTMRPEFVEGVPAAVTGSSLDALTITCWSTIPRRVSCCITRKRVPRSRTTPLCNPSGTASASRVRPITSTCGTISFKPTRDLHSQWRETARMGSRRTTT